MSKTSRKFQVIGDNFKSFSDLQIALRKAGLESSQLIIGVDYTKSNTWNGERTFGGKNLHDMSAGPNPYQQVVRAIGKTLEPFDDDNLIPVFGFGDVQTRNKAVFPFFPDGGPCPGFEAVIARYNEITPYVRLSGPTSFAPIVSKAIEIVKGTKEYHILIIIADGEITDPEETGKAIVAASEYPLSIVVIGVGDGPWDTMQRYDDKLKDRKFDNFQFVPFHDTLSKCNKENHDIEFARIALMEIPEQYQTIKRLGMSKG